MGGSRRPPGMLRRREASSWAGACGRGGGRRTVHRAASRLAACCNVWWRWKHPVGRSWAEEERVWLQAARPEAAGTSHPVCSSGFSRRSAAPMTSRVCLPRVWSPRKSRTPGWREGDPVPPPAPAQLSPAPSLAPFLTRPCPLPVRTQEPKCDPPRPQPRPFLHPGPQPHPLHVYIGHPSAFP